MIVPASSRPTRVLVAGVAIPLLFALTLAVTGTNRAMFLAIYHAVHVVPPALYPWFWESATYAGDGLAAMVLAALLLRWRVDVAIAAFLATLPIVGVYIHGIRAFVSVDRPPLVLSDQNLSVLGPVLQHGSFPSGHSATAAALAGVLVLAVRSTAWRIVFVILACVIALSRIAVGVHWPVDVCVGFAGGWLCAWIGWELAVDRAWTRPRSVQIITCVVFAGASLALLFHPMGLPEAAPFRITLSIVGLLASIAALAKQLASARASNDQSAASPIDPDASRTTR